jgi:hypothetical protein
MKRISLIAIVLVLSSVSLAVAPWKQAQESDVFDGVITGIQNRMITVVFDTPDRHKDCKLKRQHPACARTTRDIPTANWKHFDAWHWQSTITLSRPVKNLSPFVGQLLKGQWVSNEFHPVESCEVRAYNIAIKTCGDPPDYCRPPMNLYPADCTKDRSAFIQNLLRLASNKQVNRIERSSR